MALEAHLVPIYSHSSSPSLTTVVGMQLSTNTTPADSRKATVGCLVHFAGKSYCLSVAHTFARSSDRSSESYLDAEDSEHDDDCEFSGFGNADEEEYVEITSRGSTTPQSSDSAYDLDFDTATDDGSEDSACTESEFSTDAAMHLRRSENLEKGSQASVSSLTLPLGEP
jgi:hypothetical protein